MKMNLLLWRSPSSNQCCSSIVATTILMYMATTVVLLSSPTSAYKNWLCQNNVTDFNKDRDGCFLNKFIFSTYNISSLDGSFLEANFTRHVVLHTLDKVSTADAAPVNNPTPAGDTTSLKTQTSNATAVINSTTFNVTNEENFTTSNVTLEKNSTTSNVTNEENSTASNVTNEENSTTSNATHEENSTTSNITLRVFYELRFCSFYLNNKDYHIINLENNNNSNNNNNSQNQPTKTSDFQKTTNDFKLECTEQVKKTVVNTLITSLNIIRLNFLRYFGNSIC